MRVHYKTSLGCRILGIFIAFIIAMTSMPSALFMRQANAFWWGGPPSFGGGFNRPVDVMSNAEVTFYDANNKVVTEVDSGDMFFMRVSMSASNVYQFGGGTTFTVELPNDPNLLLPQFAGSGLKSGAKYNGFTLTIKGDKRYLTYNVRNGQTKEIDLQLKFKNGTTPDNTGITAIMSAAGSFTTKKTTVTSNANLNWDDSKTADPSKIDPGTPITYTLKAFPTSSENKGVVFAEEIVMTDTITLKDGMTFSAAPTIMVNGVPADIVKSDSTSVTFKYTAKSSNTKAEMPEQSVRVTMSTDTITGASGGTIENTLSTQVKGIGSNTLTDLPERNANVTISPPPAPSPADVHLTKSVNGAVSDYWSKGYLVNDDLVLFEISVSNTGDLAKEAFKLSDFIPDGNLTIVADQAVNGKKTGDTSMTGGSNTAVFDEANKSWNVSGLKKNETFTGYIVCKVNGVTSTTLQSKRNVVYMSSQSEANPEENHDDMATAVVSVKEPSENFRISKNVYADSDYKNIMSSYSDGDTLYYEVIIENNGELDIDLSDKTIEDTQKSGLSIADAEFSQGSSLTKLIPGGRAVIKYSVSADDALKDSDNYIVNTVKVDDKEAKVSVRKNNFDFGKGTFGKINDSSVAVAGGTVSYTLKFTNTTQDSGKFTDDNPLVFDDTGYDTANLTFKEAKVNGNVIGGANSPAGFTIDGTKVSYVGDISAYGTISVTYVFDVNPGAADISGNTATVSNGDITKTSDETPEIEISDIAFSVDKYGYVVDGSYPHDSTVETKQKIIASYKEFISNADAAKIDQAIGDENYGTLYPDNGLLNFITITNTGSTTITQLDVKDLFLRNGGYVTRYSPAIIVGADDGVIQVNEGGEWKNTTPEKFNEGYRNHGGLNVGQDNNEKLVIGSANDSSYRLNLQQGQSVTIGYVTIVDSGFIDGTNKAEVYANNVEDIKQEDSIQFRVGLPKMWIRKTNKNSAYSDSDPKSGSSKEYIDSSVIVINSDGKFDFEATKAKLLEKRFDYSISFGNQSNSYPIYTDDLLIEDKIPDGMEFDSIRNVTNCNGSKISIKNESGEWVDCGINNITSDIIADVSDSTIKFSFAKNYQILGTAFYVSVSIPYSMKLSDAKATEIASELQKWYESDKLIEYNAEVSDFNNVVTVKSAAEVLFDGKKMPDNTDTSDFDIVLQPKVEKLSVGFTKEKAASEVSGYDDDQLVLFPNWTVVVSNTKKDDNDGNVKGIVIEDSLTDDQDWCENAVNDEEDSNNAVNAYKIVDVNNVESEKTNLNGWNKLDASWVTHSPGNIKIAFPSNIELAPGKAIIVNFATTIKDGEMKDKLYYDRASLSIEGSIDSSRVTAGEYRDGKLWADASCGIGGIETVSYKTIQSGNDVVQNSKVTGKDSEIKSDQYFGEDPVAENDKRSGNYSDHYAQGNWAEDNYVKGYQGEEVEYTLNVRNVSSEKSMENIVIIDRLPFEMSDPGIISGYDRISAFSVFLNSQSFKAEVGNF